MLTTGTDVGGTLFTKGAFFFFSSPNSATVKKNSSTRPFTFIARAVVFQIIPRLVLTRRRYKIGEKYYFLMQFQDLFRISNCVYCRVGSGDVSVLHNWGTSSAASSYISLAEFSSSNLI
jgi:hypothetical protein